MDITANEALRTQLDSLRVEKQRFEAENDRLREDNPNEAALIDMESERDHY